MFGGLLERGRKLRLADINLVVTGSRDTIATPSPGGYEHPSAFAFHVSRGSIVAMCERSSRPRNVVVSISRV